MTPALKLSDSEHHLYVKGGELVLLRGECGSGKSLWLRRLAGLEQIPRHIRLDKDTIQDGSVRMLFDHHPQQWLGPSVIEELCFGLRYKPASERLLQLLSDWKINAIQQHLPPQKLNRLKALRLSMAAIDLAEPQLALLDSAFDGLSSHDGICMAEEISAWAKKSNTIVVVASNRWQDWQPFASQIWMIDSPEELPTPEAPVS